MSKVRIIMAACLGVLAFSALASASASAATPGWMVGGTLLSGSEKLATTAAVDEKGVLKGAGVTITCEGKTLNGLEPKIESTNKGSATTLEFTVCSAAAPCKVSPETIKTEPVSVEATLEGALAVLATFSPKTGTLFSTVTFSGSECALEGAQPITGHAKVLAPTGQDERTLQLIKAITTEATNELKIGNGAASLTGAALLKLASGKTWSFL